MEGLTKDELRSVLEAARAHRERDYLMILLAWRHGLRASEVVAITRDDVKDGYLSVARLKGSLHTIQPLVSDPDLLFDERRAVLLFISKLHGKQRLFRITRQHFWRLMQRYAEAAGVPQRKRHPHVLKHTIALQTIHVAGIENVRQYLGHKSMSSTGAYLKVSDSDAALAVKNALEVSPAL